MIDKSLFDWIKQQKQNQVNEEIIKNTLIRAGWNSSLVEEALRYPALKSAQQYNSNKKQSLGFMGDFFILFEKTFRFYIKHYKKYLLIGVIHCLLILSILPIQKMLEFFNFSSDIFFGFLTYCILLFTIANYTYLSFEENLSKSNLSFLKYSLYKLPSYLMLFFFIFFLALIPWIIFFFLGLLLLNIFLLPIEKIKLTSQLLSIIFLSVYYYSLISRLSFSIYILMGENKSAKISLIESIKVTRKLNIRLRNTFMSLLLLIIIIPVSYLLAYHPFILFFVYLLLIFPLIFIFHNLLFIKTKNEILAP